MDGKHRDKIDAEDIQEVLAYLEPLIRGRLVQPNQEELLQSFKETDGGWGHCKFMEVMRTRLKREMGDMVRMEVMKVVQTGELTPISMQTIAPQALKRIMESSEWRSLVSKTSSEVHRESLVAADNIRMDWKVSNKPGLGDSLGSTWNQSNFVFMQEEQIKQVVLQVSGGDGDQARIQALNTLLQTQVTDLIGGEHWSKLKTGLRKALASTDMKICILALRVHSRILFSSSHFGVKESYTNLIETVLGWYNDRKYLNLLPVTELRENYPLHHNLVAVLSLICAESRELPRSWIRYPKKYVSEMIDKMIELISCRSEIVLSPAHILAVLDPNITWITEWFHTFLSRSCFLVKLSKQTRYLSSIVENLLERMETKEFMSWQETGKDENNIQDETSQLISGETIEYMIFTYNLRFISKIISYIHGRDLISRGSSLISSMSNFLFMDRLATDPGRIVSNCLKQIFESNPKLYHEDITSMIDRLCGSQLELETIKNVVNSVPLISLELDRVPKLLQFLLDSVEKDSEDILFSLTLELLQSLLHQLPVRTLTIFQALCQAVFNIGMIRSLEPREQDALSDLYRSVGFFSSQPEGLVQQPDINLLQFMNSPGLEEEMKILWTFISGDKDPGRQGFGDFEDDINQILTRIGQAILSRKSIKDCWILFDFQDERMENDVYLTSVLRLLIIGSTKTDLKVEMNILGLKEQAEQELNTCFTEEDVILDEKYFLLKYLLLVLEGIAGPTEKNLPEITNPILELKPKINDKPCRTPIVPSKHLLQLIDWVRKESLYDIGWIDESRTLLRSVLVHTTCSLEPGLVSLLLQGYTKSSAIEHFETISEDLSENELSLWSMIHEYGRRTLDLETDKETLIKVAQYGLSLSGNSCFIGTLFLMAGGDETLSCDLVSSLAGTMLWNAYANKKLGDCVEWILREEAARIFVRLDSSNISPAVIANLWIQQNFLSILDFQDLVSCMLVWILQGADYLVYTIVSYFSHVLSGLENIGTYQLQDILTYRKTNFKPGDYLSFMETLASKHRNTVLKFLATSDQ